ncbi:MAG: acyl-CoA/acyl-ACP dehydrogenase [Hyphomonadaceae bacterium]|nr:acyl-CoA/acyl-ACP dehydrogenase [Hyphomonadaceae bacterium]
MGASASMVAVPAAEACGEAGVLEAVRGIVRSQLAPIVNDIDQNGLYPRDVLRALGAAGAYRTHLPLKPAPAAANLTTAIEASAIASQSCLSTGFLMWCQSTLAWYLANSENDAVRSRYLSRVADGSQLGGTGLSNPMKTFFGIEQLKLKGKRVPGGYAVRGALPWVSNLGPDHVFGTVFEVEGEPSRRVMFIADCATDGVSIQACPGFVALDGTATYSVQFRDAFVPDAKVLSDPVDGYLKKIRAGFVLLQTGMGLGVIRDCIDLMRRVQPSLGHINKFLDDQPEDLAETLAAMEAEITALALTPFDPSPQYWRRVVTLRLLVGETAVRAAHAAMLHSGARGYVMASRVQRRLREAYFVAIVTPATKQLKKMLAEMNC